MNLPALSDTLLALVEAFETPQGSGLRLTGAHLEAPLQLRLQHDGGQLLLSGAPPVTVMRTGFEAVVHRARLTMAPADVTPDNGVTPGDGDHGG